MTRYMRYFITLFVFFCFHFGYANTAISYSSPSSLSCDCVNGKVNCSSISNDWRVVSHGNRCSFQGNVVFDFVKEQTIKYEPSGYKVPTLLYQSKLTTATLNLTLASIMNLYKINFFYAPQATSICLFSGGATNPGLLCKFPPCVISKQTGSPDTAKSRCPARCAPYGGGGSYIPNSSGSCLCAGPSDGLEHGHGICLPYQKNQ